MSGEQKVRIAAIALVLFSLANILLLLGLTGGAYLIPRSVRFVITCVVAFFLFREAPWARWFVGISSALGAIVAIGGWPFLPVPMFSFLGLWMLGMGFFYGWVAYVLILDKDVSNHLSPRSGF